MALHPIPTRPTATGDVNRPHRARTALVALAAAATLTLAGCQTETTEIGITESATSTPSAEPTADTGTASADTGTTTIEAPAAGATVQGPAVTVTGTGTAFEATLLYAVADAEGASVAEGYTEAGANGEIGPFSIDLTLDPGSYTVRVWEPGMGEDDASAPPMNVAEVAFTVS